MKRSLNKEEDGYNNLFIRKIIGYTYILTFLVMGILSFPMFVSSLNLIEWRDFIFYYEEYKKTYAEIDSINISHSRGATETMTFRGYSKDLNEYKTTIEFGTISFTKFNSYFYELDNKRYAYIWYRKESEYAYPAKKEEAQFPIKEYLNENLMLFPYWILSFIINRICRFIMKKGGY